MWYLAALSKALTVCIKELGWLKENPVLMISRPPESKARDRYLTHDEIARLLEVCTISRCRYLYTIVLFALTTGARRGEILNLKWDDLDLHNKIAIFRHTKNGESRYALLSFKLVECLMRQSGRRIVISPYVFPSSDGKKPEDIEGAWNHAIRRACLPKLSLRNLDPS
jgi:integrase